VSTAQDGWLGGELVDRAGVGVDGCAHLDAPSSLSGRPAAETPTTRETRRAPNLEVLKQRATCNFEEAFVATRHVKLIVGTKVVFQKTGGNNADAETENENPR
jgi:hypothetical protein